MFHSIIFVISKTKDETSKAIYKGVHMLRNIHTYTYKYISLIYATKLSVIFSFYFDYYCYS